MMVGSGVLCEPCRQILHFDELHCTELFWDFFFIQIVKVWTHMT